MDRLLNTRLIIWIIIVVSILFIIYGVIVKINNRSRIQQSIELTYFPKKNMTKIFKNCCTLVLRFIIYTNLYFNYGRGKWL